MPNFKHKKLIFILPKRERESLQPSLNDDFTKWHRVEGETREMRPGKILLRTFFIHFFFFFFCVWFSPSLGCFCVISNVSIISNVFPGCLSLSLGVFVKKGKVFAFFFSKIFPNIPQFSLSVPCCVCAHNRKSSGLTFSSSSPLRPPSHCSVVSFCWKTFPSSCCLPHHPSAHTVREERRERRQKP